VIEGLRPWLRQALQTLLMEITEPRLINVNLPRAPKGMVWTKAGVERYDGRIVPARDPAGRDVYWFSFEPVDGAEPGTDRWAVEQQWVSFTPLRLEPADEPLVADLVRTHPLDTARAARTSPPVSSEGQAALVRADEATR
jgi:5'-nucleotidase